MDIDTVQEKSNSVTNDYAVGGLVYVEITGIYLKPYNKKQGPYIITEVFANSTAYVHRGQVNERITKRQLLHHFIKYTDR